MKKAALSEVKDDLSRFLRVAEKEEVLITRHGRPAGVLIGFESEDDWFDYRLENDPRSWLGLNPLTEACAKAGASESKTSTPCRSGCCSGLAKSGE